MVSLNDVLEPEERVNAPQVQLPHQLPDDVGHDGEDREVPLEPLPPLEGRVLQPKDLDVPWRSSISHLILQASSTSSLSERSVV